RLPPAQVLPASTGVIGVELDPRKIIDALPALIAGLRADRFPDAANAIMTTDLAPKTAFAELRLPPRPAPLPRLPHRSPTMSPPLGIVITDPQPPPPPPPAKLNPRVGRSYNRTSVDGDPSTNDTLLLMANGASGVRPDPKEMPRVEEAIAGVMESLAMAI